MVCTFLSNQTIEVIRWAVTETYMLCAFCGNEWEWKRMIETEAGDMCPDCRGACYERRWFEEEQKLIRQQLEEEEKERRLWEEEVYGKTIEKAVALKRGNQ